MTATIAVMNSSAELRTPPLALDPLENIERVLGATLTKKSKLYADIQAGLYTPPVKIGPRASRWPRSEVVALNAARIAGKSNDEIRTLVKKLMAVRTALA